MMPIRRYGLIDLPHSSYLGFWMNTDTGASVEEGVAAGYLRLPRGYTFLPEQGETDECTEWLEMRIGEDCTKIVESYA